MTSQRTVDRVLVFLGLIGLMLVGGIFVLLMTDRAVPDQIYNILIADVTAFATLLASTRTASEPAPPTQNPITITGGMGVDKSGAHG